ncbi:hypothetical protein SPF06_16225 [Sinomonas sp. JGH33]|uniref:Uncharacterized protein n=1 Tax=Sinomonas terricola TaxID=3110330 RepID=A0ABU5T9T8_9MICC|nr:hypothetical protein [Sinomonas sp. JGH33]MEA5456284.1 hypothetical protein [Sinomonas sp. JGH33]
MTPATWARALTFLRLLGLAGGLGLAWLLLGGAAAEASSLGPGTPPSPVLQTVTAPVDTAAAVVTDVQKAAASAVGTTTTALASGVASVPPAVAPLLTGPLAPVAPVVDHAASSLGGAVTTVGTALGQTVSTPVPLPSPLGPPPAPTPPAPAAPAPDNSAPAVDLPVLAPDIPVADTAFGVAPQWFVLAATTVAAEAQLAAETGAPVQLPDEPFVVPQVPASGSGGFGAGSIGPSAATLAAGWLVALPLLVSGRARRLRGLVPPSPAFDPGSTPD